MYRNAEAGCTDTRTGIGAGLEAVVTVVKPEAVAKILCPREVLYGRGRLAGRGMILRNDDIWPDQKRKSDLEHGSIVEHQLEPRAGQEPYAPPSARQDAPAAAFYNELSCLNSR